MESIPKKTSEVTPEQIKQAEEQMTPRQEELSFLREEGYGKLSPEQQELAKDCDLRDGTWLHLPQLGTGIIKGTIKGSEVKIKYWPQFGKNGPAEAKVDGKDVSPEEAKELLGKYQAIAEFQTKESADLKKSDNKIAKEKNIREQIKNMLS